MLSNNITIMKMIIQTMYPSKIQLNLQVGFWIANISHIIDYNNFQICFFRKRQTRPGREAIIEAICRGFGFPIREKTLIYCVRFLELQILML